MLQTNLVHGRDQGSAPEDSVGDSVPAVSVAVPEGASAVCIRK